MRSTPNPLVVAVAGIVVAIAVAAGCSTPGTSGAASKGERFFQTKCNACHPGGGQGAGPAIDVSVAAGFLERGKATGRHAVPESYWDPLMGYLQQLSGAPATAVAAAPGAPVAAAPVAAAPVAAAPVAVAAAPVINGDVTAGNSYFQNKCAKCHPGGKRIPGRPIPGPLTSGGSGKHGIAADQFDNVLAYLVTLGAVPTGAPVAAAPVAVAPAPVAAAPVAAPAASSSGDAAAGGSFFQTKCAKCHPGGNKIVGKAVPGVLVSGGSGKHGVPAEHFDNLLAYLPTIGAVRAGGAPVAAAPTGVPSTTTAPPARTTTPAPANNNGIIPMNAGMVNCSCSCQCPANAPPEALPAACLCQCQCPR